MSFSIGDLVITGQGARVTVLTNSYRFGGKEMVVVSDHITGTLQTYVEDLAPAPTPDYCAVYLFLDGTLGTGNWYEGKESDNECIGHFVRDTTDSKPRWEEA